LTPEQIAERHNLPAFKKTNVKVLLASAELDPGVMGKTADTDIALHDEMCAVDGAGHNDASATARGCCRWWATATCRPCSRSTRRAR
jgi:hypothetical protein